jgi:hypothetical protein
VTDTSGGLGSLSPAEIEAVATIWRREKRRLVTSFNGTSMLPAIAPGQEVVVDCGADPAVGEVAVFRFNNQVGVHRVVARTADLLVTWGDANALPDEPIEPIHVIGTIRNVPAAHASLRRNLLLRYLAVRPVSVGIVTERVRRLHRIRSVWGEGPIAFVGTALRAVIRRIPIRRT